MTAEVAVMNKLGVALAADSAATIADTKVLSATKIFELPGTTPFGMMIYGAASVLGVPWSLAIDAYEREHHTSSFDSVEDALRSFVDFLADNVELFPPEEQRDFVRESAGWMFSSIAEEVRNEVIERFESGDESVSAEEASQITLEIVDRVHELFSDDAVMDLQSASSENDIRSEYSELIEETKRETFEELPLDDLTSDRLVDVVVRMLTRQQDQIHENASGLVIAGYGERDLYPSLLEIKVVGIAAGHVVGWSARDVSISSSNASFLGAFAQGEMVSRFMEGVDPDYQLQVMSAIDRLLEGIPKEVASMLDVQLSRAHRDRLGEARFELMRSLDDELYDFRHFNFVKDILDVVRSQPLEQLAEVAETLVNLTSFKRRVSMETETVGGPIDVAVISRPDGFVWCKRKQYFTHDLNPHIVI